MSKEGWLIKFGELDSEQSADRELKKFLEVHPKAISVPQLTVPAATEK